MDYSFYNSFLTGLSNQESQIATLQQEIASGSTVQNAAQNPGAYETAAFANDQINQLNNASTTQGVIQTRLGAANSAYGSMASLFDNVQSIVEEGLNATTNSQNLNAMSGQVQSAYQQLMSLGNTQLPDGSYLFGGTRSNIPPFQIDSSGNTPGGVSYFGDSGQSMANITATTAVNTLVNGTVLTSTLNGDGTSDIQAYSRNAGTAQVLQQGISNNSSASAFQSGSNNIVISFAVGSDGQTTYTATQKPQSGSGAGTVLATGPINTTSGSDNDVVVDGMNLQITGAPHDGDSFTISPAKPQTAFTLLQNIATALSASRSTPAQVAQTNQILNQSLAELGQYQQSITVAQAQNGVTLQALTNAQTSTSAQKMTAQATVSNATAVNMPAAITALNQTMTAVEASMKTFAEAQSLSLFKYL